MLKSLLDYSVMAHFDKKYEELLEENFTNCEREFFFTINIYTELNFLASEFYSSFKLQVKDYP